jgi:hypothetical protein
MDESVEVNKEEKSEIKKEERNKDEDKKDEGESKENIKEEELKKEELKHDKKVEEVKQNEENKEEVKKEETKEIIIDPETNELINVTFPVQNRNSSDFITPEDYEEIKKNIEMDEEEKKLMEKWGDKLHDFYPEDTLGFVVPFYNFDLLYKNITQENTKIKALIYTLEKSDIKIGLSVFDGDKKIHEEEFGKYTFYELDAKIGFYTFAFENNNAKSVHVFFALSEGPVTKEKPNYTQMEMWMDNVYSKIKEIGLTNHYLSNLFENKHRSIF